MGISAFFNSLLFGTANRRREAEQKLPADTEPAVSKEEQAHDTKFYTVVANIMGSGPVSGTGQGLDDAMNLFKAWHIRQKKMFRTASTDCIKIRNKMVSENRYNDFKVTFSDTAPLAKDGWKPFVTDAFTEPFSSTHDMDDWAMATQTADILLLHGVGTMNGPNYYFHKKAHYVNHNMVMGIILFDLYKKDGK